MYALFLVNNQTGEVKNHTLSASVGKMGESVSKDKESPLIP